MSAPRLSVIIPTHNRKELLTLVLDSLARLRGQAGELEVIVVDDGSWDGTAEDLAARRDSFALQVLRNEKSAGPAAARNRGAQAARGEILGFLDSDVIVNPEWWASAAPHFDDPQVAGVEGLTRAPDRSPLPTPFTHVVANARGGNFLTCNIFYRSSVFHELKGFDERFQRANREDSDFAFSVLDRGYRIAFEPRAVVEHPLFEGRRGVYLREARYGLHEALLRRKHPGLYRSRLKWIDGRAFPVFYWGVFWGLPFMLIGTAVKLPILAALAAAVFFLGLAGSVYAVCRKRRTRLGDLLVLAPQFLVIPWLRLYWVLRGEWKYRKVKHEVTIRRKK